MKDAITHYGKYAATAVVSVGLGVGGYATLYDEPVQQTDEYQNLQNKVDNLDDRPTQDKLNELQDEVDSLEDRPTQEELTELQNQMSSMFTQEEVNEMVADATEREGLVDFLPVIVDSDVELTQTDAVEDTQADVDYSIQGVGTTVELDSDEIEGEKKDYVTATYEHDDYNHEYVAEVRTFEASDDADEFEEELRQAVFVEDFDDELGEDAEVIREGDTVVYLYGSAETEELDSYNFDQVASQYE